MLELFIPMWVIALLIFAYMLKYEKTVIRCDWNRVAQFCGFMVFATALRYSWMELSPPEKVTQTFLTFPIVFWEDAFFAIPIWFIKDKLKMSKAYWMSFAALSSILFACLHLHYGLQWALITLLYPYFISYRYGSKYGFKTIMICHIIYDFITLLSVKLFFVV